MRTPCLFVIFVLSFMAQAKVPCSEPWRCTEVETCCQNQSSEYIPQCVEKNMRNCEWGRTRVINQDLYRQNVNSSTEARVDTAYGHVIHIPSEAVQRSSQGKPSGEELVKLIVSVLNHSYFEASSTKGKPHEQVLGVWLGVKDVHNLSHPVIIKFTNLTQARNGECVFWKMPSSSEQGNWSTDGCSTIQNNSDFLCRCNHLSFFAVLISPDVPDLVNVQRLQYITYIGSSFSVLFTAVSIVVFLYGRKTKLENSIIIHIQLTGSLFLLHLSFLASSYWSGAERTVCQSLGLMLHWALLATLTWTAIEGFHLYLLLVRVFNIYIRRYSLKLSLVGWGVPTVTVTICGVAGAYGEYTLTETASNNATDLCWVASKAARYSTVNGYLGLVLLFNAVILAQAVMKMRHLRVRSVQVQNRVSRFWKDWVTVLGLSCILGLPWGLAITTHGPLSLPGIYLFTILNAFQGVLMFLWLLSITCKSNHEEQQSTKNLSMSHINS